MLVWPPKNPGNTPWRGGCRSACVCPTKRRHSALSMSTSSQLCGTGGLAPRQPIVGRIRPPWVPVARLTAFGRAARSGSHDPSARGLVSWATSAPTPPAPENDTTRGFSEHAADRLRKLQAIPHASEVANSRSAANGSQKPQKNRWTAKSGFGRQRHTATTSDSRQGGQKTS